MCLATKLRNLFDGIVGFAKDWDKLGSAATVACNSSQLQFDYREMEHTNYNHILPFPIKAVVPLSRVEKFSLEVLGAGNVALLRS